MCTAVFFFPVFFSAIFFFTTSRSCSLLSQPVRPSSCPINLVDFHSLFTRVWSSLPPVSHSPLENDHTSQTACPSFMWFSSPPSVHQKLEAFCVKRFLYLFHVLFFNKQHQPILNIRLFSLRLVVGHEWSKTGLLSNKPKAIYRQVKSESEVCDWQTAWEKVLRTNQSVDAGPPVCVSSKRKTNMR